MKTRAYPTSLVKFTLENYRSINEPLTLSMVAGKSRKNTFYVPIIDSYLLKTAVIFGANASGKSNILRGLFYLRGCLLGERKLFGDSGRDNALSPFLFCDERRQEPTSFSIHIVHEGHLFIYDLSLSSSEERILGERLRVRWPDETTTSTVFERTHDDLSISSNLPVDLHGISRSNKKIIETQTPFVASLNKLATKTIAHVFCNAMYELEVESMYHQSKLTEYVVQALYDEQEKGEDSPLKEAALNYLAQADMSISDLSVRRVDDKNLELFVHHSYEDANGNPKEATLSFTEESDGTQRFLSLLLPIADSTTNGLPFVVDELGANLHPTLLRLIVSLFNGSDAHPQLIMTSHEVSLMDDRKALTKDQIYFVEKRPDQSSDIYSLADFPDVRNTASGILSKRYLAGEFGANPKVTME